MGYKSFKEGKNELDNLITAIDFQLAEISDETVGFKSFKGYVIELNTEDYDILSKAELFEPELQYGKEGGLTIQLSEKIKRGSFTLHGPSRHNNK